MKFEATLNRVVAVFAVAMVAGLQGAATVQADTFTWTGNGGGSNWS
jgi:hypothetical protein